MKSSTSYVGLDVHKSTISVAIAEDGRSGDIRNYGVIENRGDNLVKLVGRLGVTTVYTLELPELIGSEIRVPVGAFQRLPKPWSYCAMSNFSRGSSA